MFAPITHSFARMQENIKKLLTSSVPAVSCCNLAKLYWVEEKIVYGKQRVKLNWWLACFYKEPSKHCDNVSTCFKMKPLNTLKRQGQQNVCYQYKWFFFFCDVEIFFPLSCRYCLDIFQTFLWCWHFRQYIFVFPLSCRYCLDIFQTLQCGSFCCSWMVQHRYVDEWGRREKVMSYKFLLNFFYTNREETENLLLLCLDLIVKYMKTLLILSVQDLKVYICIRKIAKQFFNLESNSLCTYRFNMTSLVWVLVYENKIATIDLSACFYIQ